jgi:hypothetical protein
VGLYPRRCVGEYRLRAGINEKEIRMKSVTLRAVLVLAVNLPLRLAIAAPPVIGTATSGGAFRLNGDTVMANGTLTEGAVIETGRGNLSVRLTGGARLSLSMDTRGKLYSDHIVLEKGETRLESGAGFHLEALGLTIHPDRGLASGRIGLVGNTRLRVVVQTGSFQVLNADGVLVANVAAGSALAFEPQASAAVTHITGTLAERSGHFLLTDRITRVTLEVTGQGLAAYLGHVVGVTGALNAAATPAARASQVIAAAEVRTAGAGAAPIAIVGGVASAATPEELAARAVGPPATPPGKPPGRPPGGPPTTPPGRPPDRPPANPPGLSR